MSTTRVPCRCCTWEIVFPPQTTVLECPACCTLNSLPVSDGADLSILTRATRQRAACDFTDAEQSYQQVLREHPDEHEALWGLVLCRYGVEYIEQAGKRRVPTCRFVRRRPVKEDSDFIQACQLAPEEVRAQYQADAAYIDNVLAEARRISENCEPFDIFVCYKASVPGQSGSFTRDFDRARDLYYKLGQDGYHVFFAHDTLQNSGGTNFDAMIYHALSTAKVMLVVCSRSDYLDAPWVRSEWSRYLERVDDDPSLHLVPLLYDDLPPEALPSAFVNRRLEGLRMGELNALDNLRATLSRYLPRSAEPDNNLLLRARMELEDRNWEAAATAARLLLDEQPRCAAGHICLLLSGLRCISEEQLADVTEPFESTLQWERALRFATSAERAVYEELLARSLRLRERLRKIDQLRRSLADQQLTAEFDGDSVILVSGRRAANTSEIIVPEGVTMLADHAFAGCASLTRVVLPEGLVSIGSETFAGCEALRVLHIPDSVKTIGERAFSGCTALVQADLPASLVSIGEEAFLGCFSLCRAVIPEGVTTIPDGAFCSCSALTQLSLPVGLTAIGARAFMECCQLRLLDLPPALMALGESAFEGCFRLLGLVLPSGVTEIPTCAFKRCSGLREVDLPRSLKAIGREAFAMCVELRKVSLPALTAEASDAFSTCLQLRRHYLH